MSSTTDKCMRDGGGVFPTIGKCKRDGGVCTLLQANVRGGGVCLLLRANVRDRVVMCFLL